MLSDADARRTYDAYGMDGVRAGRELGARGKTTEEMRIEYERRRAKETKEAAEARLNHSGTYVFGFSAAHLMEESIARRRAAFTNNPGLDLTSVSLQNSMEIPLSEEDAVYTVTQGNDARGTWGGEFYIRVATSVFAVDVARRERADGADERGDGDGDEAAHDAHHGGGVA